MCWIAGIVTWLAMVIYMIKTVKNKKSSIKLWSKQTLYNPFNIIWCSDKLSAAGIEMRRKFIKSAILFFACILIGMFCGVIAKLLAF